MYDIDDPDLALGWVFELAATFTDAAYGPEIRRLGRTLRRWAEPIAARHALLATNGPVETIIIWNPHRDVVDV